MTDKYQQAAQLITRFEGCKLKAYLDSIGKPTIGIGTTVYPDGTEVEMGDTCTLQEAQTYLQDHLQKKVYPYVDSLLSNCESYPDEVYAVLCSFGYNLGCGFFTKDSFIVPVSSCDWGTFDEDSYTGTGLAGTLIKYNKARVNGRLVVVKGLTNRRIGEVKYMLRLN